MLWTIGTNGEGESEKSVLAVQHDNDDDIYKAHLRLFRYRNAFLMNLLEDYRKCYYIVE